MVLRREPALWAGLLNAVLACVFAFWVGVTPAQQGAIMACATAVLGVVVWVVTHDGGPALVLGLAKSVLSLALAFGVHWSVDRQALLLSVVAVATSLFVRTQVTSSEPPA